MRLTPALAIAACAATFSLNAAQTNKPAATKPPAVTQTNKVVAPVGATPVVTNKVDIKDLMALPAFTNSTGMLMVKISSSLWAGKYEVTQEEYQKIIGLNPSKFGGNLNPVDSVSWNEAMEFCAKLNDAEKKEDLLLEGYKYSLPTQAQWENLAAGTSLKSAVTSENSSRNGTAAVGSLEANGLGLYDVRGNLWEWCLDPQDKPFRVLRGAAWDTHYEPSLRPEFRWYSNGPGDKKPIYGFRVVLTSGGQ